MQIKKKSEHELIWPSLAEEDLFLIEMNNIINEVSNNSNIKSDPGDNKTSAHAGEINLATGKSNQGKAGNIVVSPSPELITKSTSLQPGLRFGPAIGSLGKNKTVLPKSNDSDEVIISEVNLFTVDQLYNCLDDFAEKCKQENKLNLAYTLNQHRPKLNENFEVEFFLDSNLQEKGIDEIKIELLNFVRSNLKNGKITIVTKVDPSNLEKMAYTTQEKFDELTKINPELIKLKNLLDLDLGI